MITMMNSNGPRLVQSSVGHPRSGGRWNRDGSAGAAPLGWRGAIDPILKPTTNPRLRPKRVNRKLLQNGKTSKEVCALAARRLAIISPSHDRAARRAALSPGHPPGSSHSHHDADAVSSSSVQAHSDLDLFNSKKNCNIVCHRQHHPSDVTAQPRCLMVTVTVTVTVTE